jgi:hypothetical protein
MMAWVMGTLIVLQAINLKAQDPLRVMIERANMAQLTSMEFDFSSDEIPEALQGDWLRSDSLLRLNLPNATVYFDGAYRIVVDHEMEEITVNTDPSNRLADLINGWQTEFNQATLSNIGQQINHNRKTVQFILVEPQTGHVTKAIIGIHPSSGKLFSYESWSEKDGHQLLRVTQSSDLAIPPVDVKFLRANHPEPYLFTAPRSYQL